MIEKTPSGELVCEAFLRTQQGADWGITTTLPALKVVDQKGLPKDNWGNKTLWVTPRAYGSATMTPTQVRQPVLGISVWSQPTDKRRFWGKAMDLSETLIDLGIDWTNTLDLVMPYPGYAPVRLTSFTPLSVGRRVEGDSQGLGRVDFDVQLTYSVLKNYGGNVTPSPVYNGGTIKFDQASAMSWTVTHDLGYYPMIQLFDLSGNEIEGSISQLNKFSFVVNFNSAVAGWVLVR